MPKSRVSISVHQEEELQGKPTTAAIPTTRAKLRQKDIPRVNFREDSQPITTKEIRDISKVKIEDGEKATSRVFVEAMGRAEARASSKAKERGRKGGECEHLPLLCS